MYAGAWVDTEKQCPECGSQDTVRNANRGLLCCEGCGEEMRLGEVKTAPDEFIIFSSPS
jgi:ribosomal protein L37AE/L43A